ncbi:ERF superfamily protein [Vibrio phage 1.162.O._10N.261.48.E3]|nr:ERF superfamily protein [Vibrio phage 1.147.O._10N.286.49.E9]AUR91709.1 ERF superfamily protein [Vibrio phage 1.162.O._10N.261.48.E3]
MSFYKSLIQVQSTLNAPKNQRNNFGKYNYRSCEDIMQAVKPLLASHNLVQFVSDEIELVGERYYVKATVTVTDGTNTHSVSAYAREPIEQKGMSDSQLTGTASSYARKYALNGMYNIDDSKDADTNEFRQQATQQAQKKQTAVNFDEVLEGFEVAADKAKTEEELKQLFAPAYKTLSASKTHQAKAKNHYDIRKSEIQVGEM